MIGSVRVLGCGRWAMGDDQAGLLVADSLRNRGLPQTTVEFCEAPATGVADPAGEAVGLLVIVDAARADERHPPGTFLRLDYCDYPAPAAFESPIDTHSPSVDAGLRLAAALDVLPEKVWIYVIFGEYFDRSSSVGERVRAGIPRLADGIERDISSWIATESCTSCL